MLHLRLTLECTLLAQRAGWIELMISGKYHVCTFLLITR